MRESRIILENVEAYYHVSNEIREDLKKLTKNEQEQLEGFIFAAAESCKIEVVAYTVYSLGYDMLVRIPKPHRVKDSLIEEIIKKHFSESIWENYLQLKNEEKKDRMKEIRDKHRLRLFSLQDFVRFFSQRFSRFYNEKYKKKGQVWRQRFRSFPVLNDGDIIRDVIGYVHARPATREGDMKKIDIYPFSSWPKVLAGDPKWRKSYNSAIGEKDWRKTRKMFLSSIDIMQGRMVRPYYGEVNTKLVEKYRRKNRMTRDKLEDRKKQWKSMYNKLKRYGEKNGNFLFPAKSEKYQELIKWVRLQRSYYKKDKISVEHKKLLDKINFPFDKAKAERAEKNRKISQIWLKKYELLKDYKEKHGHIKPPYKNSEVYSFVNYQRTMKKKNKLTMDQVQMLDELNFPWRPEGKKHQG